MARTKRTFDTVFFISVALLVGVGFFIFSSASLGLLAREGATFSSVAFNQIVLGIFGGSIALYIFSHISFTFWRKYAPHIFILSLFATLLVFVPGLGFEHGGAKRWLQVFGVSVQPSELLKLGFIFAYAWWLSKYKKELHTFTFGIIPFFAFLGTTGLVLLLQPDTGTFLSIAAAGGAMYLSAGARARDVLIVVLIAVTALTGLVMSRDYARERILTFINPSADPQGAGYQIEQSLIAVGSGGLFGRGFGQSVQKFNFLPEPIGDSIFSVYAEEFGFVGSILLIMLFLFFAFQGLKIATSSPDLFSGLVVTGIVILIVSQSFINIGAMLGIVPLTGMPLLFISHGGTAMFFALIEVGIILNISRHRI